MAGLVAIVNNLRGGLSGERSPGSKVLSPVIVNLIVSAGHDAALYANKTPSFNKPGGVPSLSVPALLSTLPPGLKDIETKRLILPSLVRLLGRVSNSDSLSAALQTTRQALSDWNLSEFSAGTFSIFQTITEDHMKWQAHAHLRLAGLMLSSRLLDDEEYVHALYAEALLLQPETLVGTVYDEMIFWSLFIISATVGRCDSSHMQILYKLQLDLELGIWDSVQHCLQKYALPPLLNESAYALWTAMSFGGVELDSELGVRERTRYVRGSQHPMTWLGLSLMSATDQSEWEQRRS